MNFEIKTKVLVLYFCNGLLQSLQVMRWDLGSVLCSVLSTKPLFHLISLYLWKTYRFATKIKPNLSDLIWGHIILSSQMGHHNKENYKHKKTLMKLKQSGREWMKIPRLILIGNCVVPGVGREFWYLIYNFAPSTGQQLPIFRKSCWD